MIMTENDAILSKPVGQHRNIAGFMTPFFAARHTTLPRSDKRVTQVLIMVFGGLQWINVEPSDVTLF
jgi:hypothetical protein